MTKTITEKDLTQGELETVQLIKEKYMDIEFMRNQMVSAKYQNNQNNRKDRKGNLYDFPLFRKLSDILDNDKSSIKEIEMAWNELLTADTSEYVVDDYLYGGEPYIDTSVKGVFVWDNTATSFHSIKNVLDKVVEPKEVSVKIHNGEAYLYIQLKNDDIWHMLGDYKLVVDMVEKSIKVFDDFGKNHPDANFYKLEKGDILGNRERVLYADLDKIVKNNDKTITKKDLTLEERLLINSIF